MTLRFFSVPALHAEPAAGELNRCLATERIAHVEKSFVADGAGSYWAVCVTVVDDGDDRRPERRDGRDERGERSERGDAARRRGTVDYRELLAADEFALYDRLRIARKQAAEADGLPTYAVFTNDQLAAMVRGRMTSAAALATIDGVGEGRISRYGATFLALLHDGVPRLTTATRPPAGAGS